MDYYLGEIIAFAYARIPYGSVQCNGQTLGISANAALFSLLGTVWGGNGTSDFAVPNLKGRSMVGLGTPATNSGLVVGTLTWAIGNLNGTDTYTISGSQLPAHVHEAVFTPTYTNGQTSTSAYVQVSSNNGKIADPSGNYLAKTYDNGAHTNNLSYIAAADAGTLTNLAGVGGGTGGMTGGTVVVGVAGNSAGFTVNDPGAGMNFCIVTIGIYPSFN